jgi:cytochrome oxidase Cu insertion factor (SCO1/SenC/PrrC family)
MPAQSDNPRRTIWIGLVLLGAILGLTFWMNHFRPSPPPLPVLGTVAEFTLTNQAGIQMTRADLLGRVWLADIIFTRCAGPCPRMTRQLAELQQALPNRSEARLISLTTDPDFDTPPVLARYAQQFGAATNRWQFLTGTKSQIAGLAIDSLKLTTLEKPVAERTDANDLFIHSTIFVLVDRAGRLRGIYETGGDGVDWPQVRGKILADIKQLEGER